MPQDPAPPAVGHGLPEPIEALLLAAHASTRPTERMPPLCAALEALLKTLVGVAMADLVHACGADEAQVHAQLDLLASKNSDGIWLTTLQSLARELAQRPSSWLGARWKDLGNGGSPVVQALAAAVAKRNEFAHPKLLDSLHGRKHAKELQDHLAAAVAALPWLRELAVVRPRDVQPTVSGFEGALVVAGPKPERVDGRWSKKVLPEFLYLYDRTQQRLLCLHPWLIPSGHEMAGVQRALVLDDLRDWPKLSWKNAAIHAPAVPAKVGEGGLAAWLVRLVPAESRSGKVATDRPLSASAAASVRLMELRQEALASSLAASSLAASLGAAQGGSGQPAVQSRPRSAVPAVAPTPATATAQCNVCAAPLRVLTTGMRLPLRGSVLQCPSCQTAYHTAAEPTQLSGGALLRRLWEPRAPRPLSTLLQAELLRTDVGKSKAIAEVPYTFSRKGAQAPAGWLGRLDDGQWLIVAGQGVVLRDDHAQCDAALLRAGSRFNLGGVEMVLARAP